MQPPPDLDSKISRILGPPEQLKCCVAQARGHYCFPLKNAGVAQW